MNQLPVNQITSLIPEKLCFQAKQLNSTLKSIQPNSEIAQLITYTLIATAIVGITVYHYIKAQENNSFIQDTSLTQNNSFNQELGSHPENPIC